MIDDGTIDNQCHCAWWLRTISNSEYGLHIAAGNCSYIDELNGIPGQVEKRCTARPVICVDKNGPQFGELDDRTVQQLDAQCRSYIMGMELELRNKINTRISEGEMSLLWRKV